MQAEPQHERTWTIAEQGARFRVRSLHRDDHEQHMSYQRLRAEIFGAQLRWQVVVTPDGREIDRYDQCDDPTIQAHTVSLVEGDEEHLVGGVRTFALCSWEASMVMQEFRVAGMFSDEVLGSLQEAYQAEKLLEVTRLCVQRRHCVTPTTALHRQMAQDFTYATVYRVAEVTGRSLVLAVVSTGYRCLLQRMGFVIHVHATHEPGRKTGYTLTIIDLVASMHRMRATGKQEQAARLLSLCQQDHWLT